MKQMLRPGLCKQRLATALGLYVLLLTGAAQAVPLTWDADTGTTGAQDGSGTWTTGSGSWWTGTANANWAAYDSATFGAGTDGDYTITIGGAISATAITFNNSGYTLRASAARTITLSNSVTIASGKSATISTNVTFTRAGSYSVLGGGTINVTGSGAILRTTGGNSVMTVSASNTKVVVGAGGRFDSGSSMVIGIANNTSVQLEVDGGDVNVGISTADSNLVLANGGASSIGSATITLKSGNIINDRPAGSLRFGHATEATTSSGTFNLDGGQLRVARVWEGAAGGFSSTFNFNGGTLKVATGTTSAATFMQGIDTVNVRNNGAIFDTNGENVTVGQSLLHSIIGGDNAIDGGLTKLGAGTLTLTNANTYSGSTIVSNGTLLVNNATGSGTGSGSVVVTNATLGGIGSISGAVTINNNGTLAPGTNNLAGGILTCAGGLTLGAGVTVAIDCTAATSDRVAITGALTLQGANTVAMTLNDGTVPKEVTLFTFDSVTGDANLTSWTVTGLPSWYAPRVRKSGNSLVVVSNAGTLVSFF